VNENAQRGECLIFLFKKKQKKVPDEKLAEIRDELREKSKLMAKMGGVLAKHQLTKAEKRLIQRIQDQTSKLNQNNVTRTKAYLDFYLSYPTIHWAFLGHMVSRNGGWNMTDLKGELLADLLSSEEKVSYFSFLERGNWLIFQDAYPQFLLYQESIKANKPYFYLLQALNVSTFMETIWNHFWRNHDPYILTIGLVINEQSYIENRLIQNPTYQKEVLHTLEFLLQELFSFTQILFPYETKQGISLTGKTVQSFASLPERIELGKKLYAILFQNIAVLNDSLKWATTHPHTGSRKDYWPHLFHHLKAGVPRSFYLGKIESCKLKPGSDRIYSPELTFVWKDIVHTEAEKGDWFNDWRVTEFLSKRKELIDGEIINEYCKTLEKLELAAMAKNALSILE
jgi:hypothetical protein